MLTPAVQQHQVMRGVLLGEDVRAAVAVPGHVGVVAVDGLDGEGESGASRVLPSQARSRERIARRQFDSLARLPSLAAVPA
jgi:hypothetical protein